MASRAVDELCNEIADQLMPAAAALAKKMGLTFGVGVTVKPVAGKPAPSKPQPLGARRPGVHPTLLKMEASVGAHAAGKAISKASRIEAVVYVARAHLNMSFNLIARHYGTSYEIVFDAYCRGISKVDDDEPVFKHLVHHAKKGAANA